MPVPLLAKSQQADVAGWFGKLPALGDFASRRLSQSFINRWDDWLQRSLARSRTMLGDCWLEHYLNGPVWRFVLLPGICDAKVWAGILMPSVDRVGRYYPLTIAAACDPRPAAVHGLLTARSWFQGIEDAALSSLQLDCNVETFDRRLAALGGPSWQGNNPQLLSFAQWWRSPASEQSSPATCTVDRVEDLLCAASAPYLPDSRDGKSLWWRSDDSRESVALMGFVGLPPPDHFAAMLSAGGC